MPGAVTGFPVHDGGMLLAMIEDLRANGFFLPAVTSYNYLDLPFAYPPFGIYVAAFLSGNSLFSGLELLRWLPPLLSVASIPAFYWLAQQIFDSKSKAFIASALYAVMPGAYDWLIMGGGLTRSFGILFYLLAVGYVYRLFRDNGDKFSAGLATLLCALAVLSHPEVGLQTAGTCFLLWISYGRSASGAKNAMAIALGTVLLTAVWWLSVLYYHGFSPIQSAMQTGIRETLFASLFHTIFSTQGGLPVLSIFGLIGAFVVLHRRAYLLVVWTLLPFFVDPRNAPAIAIFPLLMLASEGLYHVNLKFTRAFSESFPKNEGSGWYATIFTRLSLAVMLVYLFYVSYASGSNLVAVSLNASDRGTMEWVRENTPPESRFLLITNSGQISPMTDSYQEWFPVLARRQSVNTLQGKEWLLGSRFFKYSQGLRALQACPDIDCLNDWLEENNAQVDFILCKKPRASGSLIDSLRADERYSLVYETTHAEIFALTP